MTQRTYQFGITAVAIHTQQMLDGIEAGMKWYFDTPELERFATTGEEIVSRMLEVTRESRNPLKPGCLISPEWCVGAMMGYMAAMLHPDLRQNYQGIFHRDMLSQHCETLFNDYRQQFEVEHLIG